MEKPQEGEEVPAYKESISQIHLLRWFRLQYPDIADLLIGYPAGNNLNLLTAVRMKAMGLRVGMPDLHLLVPRFEPKFIPGLLIEMKSERGRLSKAQNEFHDKLISQHYTIVTCYSFDEAKHQIQTYLK